MTGSGMVLEDNGGDDLTMSKDGAFTFATKIASGGTYSVTIKTQPSNPSQVCSVSNNSGTATANVTNVQVTCAATYTVGGTVSGLQGSGLVLQDNGGDDLTVSGTGTVNFTFATPLLGGAAYTVTIKTQPSNPTQTCAVSNGTGTIVGSVANVQVSCQQPKFPVGGTVVGLVVGSGDTMELQDNAGDNLFVTGDVDFTFPTQFTYGTTYSVDVFLEPTSQPLIPCNVFNATAVVTGIVSNVIVDCQHNDWAWMFPGPSAPTLNQYGTAKLPTWQAGKPIPMPLFATGNSNTPGGRDFAMAWNDNQGNRWVFGGFGFEVTHDNTDGIPGLLNDMWVWPVNPGSKDDGWWIPGAWIPANLPIVLDNTTGNYSADITSLQLKNLGANYGTQGAGSSCAYPAASCTTPGARWGGITWTDTLGNLWMLGGQGIDAAGAFGLLNDVWEFDMTSCNWDGTTGTGTFTNCKWVWQSGSSTADQPTTATLPGGRWGAASYKDAAGNVWMFGGQGYDSASPTKVGLLNDLWKYNMATATWTLVSGTTTADQNGMYGTQGTAAAGNAPGGRQTAVLWADKSGNIWLFGGFGLDSKGTSGTTQTGSVQIGSVLNDLWKYDPVAAQWTWVSGSNLADQNGVYGTQGISNATTNAAATNVPGSRWGAMGWANPDGNLFLFGGFGYGSSATQPTGFLNDVWEYQLSSGEWIWWKGSVDADQPGTYITTPDIFQLNYTNNAVGARRGAAHWAPDRFGYVYVFGGEGYAADGGPYGELNDLWRYLPFPTN